MGGRSGSRGIVARTGIVFALVLAASLQPARSSCQPLAVPFTSYPAPGTYSYIYAADWGPNFGSGVTFYGLPYDFVPALDADATLFGVFWALGTGNPAFGEGDDSGTFPATDWLSSRAPGYYNSTYYYSPYVISQTVGWGTDNRIDGCITNNGTGCMCVMLNQNETTPQFLLASAMLQTDFMIEFNQPGNAPMVLAQIPRPVIREAVRDGATNDLTFTFTVPNPVGGVYYKDACDCGLQYQVREHVVPRGDPAPGDAIANFSPLPDHGPTDFTVFVNATSDCGDANNDVYLVTQLLADDGFGTTIASSICGPIECGPNVVNSIDEECCSPPASVSCGSDVGECSSGSRSCDAMPLPGLECCESAYGSCVGAVGPTAEVCDGLDNDCDGTDDNGTDQPTTCGVGECASTGVIACVGGALQPDTCTEGSPMAEVCDGLDNDCDGTNDNGADQPTTCGVGECASTGVIACVGGVPQPDTCMPGTATAEVCDGLDNDCDGTVDNGVAIVDGDTDGVLCNQDCDDMDINTYPGAPEVDDDLDNQCPGDYGYGVIDENSGTSGFFNPADLDEYSWPAVSGATQYEYLRSNVRNFASGCVTAVTTNLFWSDTFVPNLGEIAYYLNRPLGGSWGVLTGGERMPVCGP